MVALPFAKAVTRYLEKVLPFMAVTQDIRQVEWVSLVEDKANR